MIRSSKVSLKFANLAKKDTLAKVLSEYQRVTRYFIDILWELETIPTLPPKSITSLVSTWLSSRLIQCSAKQASGIVRGTKQKFKQRQYIIEKLKKEGKTQESLKLQKIQDAHSLSKPEINSICPELDVRFCKIELNRINSFDGWLTLSSLGDKIKLMLPFRRNKHFNKLLEKGKLKPGIRLTNSSVTFMFEMQPLPKVANGITLGIDIGMLNTISCSNGFQSQKNGHGYDLSKILTIMNRKQKGSKAFKRCQAHRTNYINWSINQLNLQGVKQVNLENIKDLRRGRKSSGKLSHWTYRDIFGKLNNICEQFGVQVVHKSPTYTSQRCSRCGWTQKTNRHGKLFCCKHCNYTCDADLNASINISLNLPAISREERLRSISKLGFYWLTLSQEHTVPDVQKTLEHLS